MTETAIAIVEDNPYVREAWGAMVQGEEEFHLAGAYASCEDILASDALEHADVLLLDIGLPGRSGVEGLADMRRRQPRLLVIMCTVFEDDTNIFNALCAGAVGYILKKTAPEEMIRAIYDVIAGGSPMSPSIARKVIKSFHVFPPHPAGRHEDMLSEREQEILTRLVQGKSYPVIAHELFISVDGVRYHLRHIYEKLQVSTRAEAVARGLKNRMVPPPR
jgi:DNA-binding NarL/FixJ family response regulator